MDGIQYLLFQGWVRILIGAALCLLSYFWVRRKLIPSVSPVAASDENEGSGATAQRPEFPVFSLAGLVLLWIGFLWYANFELAYRNPTQKPDYSIQTERERTRKERLSEEIPVNESRSETLAEKSARMQAEADAQNAKAKEEFKKLKPEEKRD